VVRARKLPPPHLRRSRVPRRRRPYLHGPVWSPPSPPQTPPEPVGSAALVRGGATNRGPDQAAAPSCARTVWLVLDF
jgi:hypothetical protein